MNPSTAIVIGGGIAGCTTAHALAQRGIKVTLLERNANIASEASGNPIAMLYPRLSGNDVASQFALKAYEHSLQLYKSLNLAATSYNNCGLLQLGFNERESARIQKVASQHYPASLLSYASPQQASVIAGIDILHPALYFKAAAWLNPQAVCRRLLDHENIKEATSINAFNILKNKDNYEVLSQEHDGKELSLLAEVVVIANANQAQSFSQTKHLNTQAVRGQVSLLKATEASEQLKTIVCSDGYFSPMVNGQHCLGATFSTEKSDCQPDDQDHLTNLESLKIISESLYHSLQSNITGGRVSMRCSTSDYFPLVGELLDCDALKTNPPRPSAPSHTLPKLKGLYANLAHGSKGFTSAPLCAELLASFICKEPLPISNEIAGLLNPNRMILREMGLKRLAKMIDTLH